jgi:dTDP-4-amino-4,6-dideoxygalactose transaminase
VEVGYNYRMTDIQAAVGIKQLEKLDWIVAERRKIAMRYNEAFKDIDCIQLPIEKEGYFSNYQSYSIYLKDNCPVSRNEIMQKMLDDGISSRRGIMTTHRETAYKTECAGLSLPISEKSADRSIILPLYIPMKNEDIEKVIEAFRMYVSVPVTS